MYSSFLINEEVALSIEVQVFLIPSLLELIETGIRFSKKGESFTVSLLFSKETISGVSEILLIRLCFLV